MYHNNTLCSYANEAVAALADVKQTQQNSNAEVTGKGMDDSMKEKLIGAITDAAHQLCGTSYTTEEIRSLVHSSVSFPNKNGDLDGKPHDVEIRIALSLFHKARKRKRGESLPIDLISDFGLARVVQTPIEVADLFCQILNQEWDVRIDYSGIMCLVTEERSQSLRASGRLPCPRCVKWCKGEKGLWWHQQKHQETADAVQDGHNASDWEAVRREVFQGVDVAEFRPLSSEFSHVGTFWV